jgi:selenium metabolism protein YedF
MKTTIILHSATLGRGEDKLGEQLMASFLRKLWMSKEKPDSIIFYNTSVKLVCEGSLVLDALDALARAGVDLIICQTCVGYYEISDKIRVGRVSNMEEIISVLMKSTKVITP